MTIFNLILIIQNIIIILIDHLKIFNNLNIINSFICMKKLINIFVLDFYILDIIFILLNSHYINQGIIKHLKNKKIYL